MTVETVQLFYAILSLVAFAIVGVVLVSRLGATVWTPAGRGDQAIAEALQPSGVAIAWIVAMLATLGSLFFSEVAHYDPCRLCWYQRIAMYPLAIILGVATIRHDDGIRIYGQVLAAIGAGIAAYHLALEWIPALDTGACGTGPACTIVWFRTFGFISLPFLALSAFLLILTLLSVRNPATKLAQTTQTGARHDSERTARPSIPP
jgi:disulfide bond formation protein DsbB